MEHFADGDIRLAALMKASEIIFMQQAARLLTLACDSAVRVDVLDTACSLTGDANEWLRKMGVGTSRRYC